MEQYTVPNHWNRNELAWWSHVDHCTALCGAVWPAPTGEGESAPEYDRLVSERGLNPVMNMLVRELGGLPVLKAVRDQMRSDGEIPFKV
jgi:hypothetical protein